MRGQRTASVGRADVPVRDFLVKHFPDIPIEWSPWPHWGYRDAVVSWVGFLGRRAWLRITGGRIHQVVEQIPGAVQTGPSEVMFPALPGRGGNNLIREQCLRGHRLAGPNVYRTPGGRRQCRACKRERRERAG